MVNAYILGGSTYYQIEAATRNEIDEAIARIKQDYHPLGYGTSFDQPHLIEENGRWSVRGRRANSCD